MAVAHTIPLTHLFQRAFVIPQLEYQWYTQQDETIRQQAANTKMLAETFGALSSAEYPGLRDHLLVINACATEYEEWLLAFQLCRRQQRDRVGDVIDAKLIAEVLDLVDQVSNLQLCYNVVVGEAREICACLCPEALESFDLRFESGA